MHRDNRDKVRLLIRTEWEREGLGHRLPFVKEDYVLMTKYDTSDISAGSLKHHTPLKQAKKSLSFWSPIPHPKIKNLRGINKNVILKPIRISINLQQNQQQTWVSSSIPSARMFKAFVLEADHLIPKISLRLPRVWKSLKDMEGLEHQARSNYKSVKQRVDAIDKENFSYSYSVIEVEDLMGVFESISYEIKITATPDGGSICQNTSKCHAKGDAQVTEEEIKSGKEKASAMFRLLRPISWPILMPRAKASHSLYFRILNSPSAP
ncbi:unnamed protein product [Thlaspi arvense]|uniref:Bet v I/Major latex protein domain-containing protein n=1 Tax=Thlaspi arvense TaxID=13288 RepID=A0AAU9S781_THLAR|nr:unnamed protein product [Thlaspi arvense]